MQLNRVYKADRDDPSGYIGKDMIMTSNNYILFLIYDIKEESQIIRIFSKNETFFVTGYIDISLKDFKYDISTLMFLDQSKYYTFYIRDQEKWRVYNINDVELVIDSKNQIKQFKEWINSTFEWRIEVHDNNITHKIKYQYFNVSFLHNEDTTPYYIELSEDKHIVNSYGDPNFIFHISSKYLGPNLKFNMVLSENIPYGDNITLPLINDQFESDSKIHSIDDDLNWIEILVKKFRDKETDELMISIIFLEHDFISTYIYQLSNKKHVKTIRSEYSHSNFIDIEIATTLYKKNEHSDFYYLLSKENSTQGSNYAVHTFSFSNKMLNWVNKFGLPKDSIELRIYKPMIQLYLSFWSVLVDKSEYNTVKIDIYIIYSN